MDRERDAAPARRAARTPRMSVEQPLWTALTWFRVLTLGYAIASYAVRSGEVAHPMAGWAFMCLLAAWTFATFRQVSYAQRCTFRFLTADIAMALGGILFTMYVETEERVRAGEPTLPSIWTAGAVLGFAVKGGWRWGAMASTAVGISNIVERGALVQTNIHNIVLLMVASTAIGYIVEVARASERTLARALQIEAATRERERLARGIHDSVLQVLSMVQRRGTALGGEAAELGALAGEQEAALRALVTGGPGEAPASGSAPAPARQDSRMDDARMDDVRTDDARTDLRRLLAPHAGARVAVAEPGGPVLLAAEAAHEVAAAVGAALDNVRAHAGEEARAWILVEDEADAVIVTVRDDGPGIPEGRLAEAEAQGRLGVAQSIRGRLVDLGGSAELLSVPGQGTEVELRVPRVAVPPARSASPSGRRRRLLPGRTTGTG